MAKSFGVKIEGIDNIAKSIDDAKVRIPRAIMHALGAAADELRDIAQQNVQSSQYNLSHISSGIQARMSKKLFLTSEVGYYTDNSNWHLKFFERNHTRKGRGTIKGGYFLKQAGTNAESIAQNKVEESVMQMLRDCGLA